MKMVFFLKENVFQGCLSDDENVFPLSKKNTREEHVEKGKKMVWNDMISHRAYLILFIFLNNLK